MTKHFSVDARPLPAKVVATISIACFAILVLLTDMELGLYDESLILQGAVEVKHGAIPHRDFFFTYGPLQLWIISGLFSVFGKCLLVARLYEAAVRAGIIFVSGLMARGLGLRSGLTICVMLLEMTLLSSLSFYLFPVFPTLLCSLAGTLLLVDADRREIVPIRRMMVAGMFTGLSALFRYDIGFLVLISHLITLCFFCFDRRDSFQSLFHKVGAYGLGISLVFVPVAIGAWVAGAIPGFVHDIVIFLPSNYPRMRILPWPMPSLSRHSLVPLACYVPFVSSLLGMIWFLRSVKKPSENGSFICEERLFFALLLLASLFIVKGLVRVSLIHSVLALVPSSIVLFYLVTKRNSKFVWSFSVAALAFLAMLVSVNGLGFLAVEVRKGFGGLLPVRALNRTAEACQPPALGAGFVDDDTLQASCYIASQTAPGERIYAGAGRHDKLYASNAALYFLSDRRPATHWYHLEPGLQTQRKIQREMIAELARNDVRVIALDKRFDDVIESNGSAHSYGVHDLDEYIRSHYAQTTNFGNIIILKRTRP